MRVYQTLMNDIKNSNVQGAYVQPVPVGLPLMLSYSDKGILTKVSIRESDDLPFELVVKLQSANILIQRLQSYKAECQVLGVLVPSADKLNLSKTCGMLPQALYPSILKLISSDPYSFKFYAIDLSLASTPYLPIATVLSRLNIMKFVTIPGAAMSSNLSLQSLVSQFDSQLQQIQPKLPLLQAIYLHASEPKWFSAYLRCGKVTKFENTLDVNGYVHGKVACNFGDCAADVITSYSQVVKHQLHSGSIVVFDEDYNIQYASAPRLFSKVASPDLTCAVCGKKYTVSPSALFIQCADPHCPSMLYPQIARMLSKFGLPHMSESRFIEVSRSGKVKKLVDVLNLEEYCDCVVSITMSTLIEAITPANLLARDKNGISKFVHQASSSVAVSYYIHNPIAIANDLQLNAAFISAFQSFWRDSDNVETYDSFIDHPSIFVVNPAKKFNGDMILRNKEICLTGEFKHGSYDEMFSILKSYAGSPTVGLSAHTSSVLVGHFGNVDPYIIEQARSRKLPIFRELDFFSAYQIDADLAKFHLI